MKLFYLKKKRSPVAKTLPLDDPILSQNFFTVVLRSSNKYFYCHRLVVLIQIPNLLCKKTQSLCNNVVSRFVQYVFYIHQTEPKSKNCMVVLCYRKGITCVCELGCQCIGDGRGHSSNTEKEYWSLSVHERCQETSGTWQSVLSDVVISVKGEEQRGEENPWGLPVLTSCVQDVTVPFLLCPVCQESLLTDGGDTQSWESF